MNVSDVIIPGDKVDIKFLHQQNAEENGGAAAQVYQSSVCDYLSDSELELAMPTKDGKMVLFQIGAACSFVFYTKNGMYQCNGSIKDRYRKDNLYLLAVLITTAPVKFQRREFFRIQYLTEVKYYDIGEDVVALPTTEQLFVEIQNLNYLDSMHKAYVQDISGGGVRFNSSVHHNQGDYILLLMRLSSGSIDEMFYLVCRVIDSTLHPSLEGMYSNRAKFMYKDLKDREKIVRFVFEEERRIRKKEIG